ncbi:MAG: AAA family ATPase, partial [bacterium]|nr:AAA family ATPase [bacterium]
AVLHRQAHILDVGAVPPKTKLDVLKSIWSGLLPHRELIILDADIRVRPTGTAAETPDYDAGDLSDGERVIFYLIGQCLLANAGIIIVDEPELHINKAVLAKLWDLIEASRTDCGFIYLTHDLEFAASRRGAARYALRGYETVNGAPQWEIDEVPKGTGLSEEVVSKIVGSRQPVLFVEGDGGSLDSAIYRRVFADMTVIPIGDCDGVIHAVSTFRKHAALHRVGCAGIIDADGREAREIVELDSLGIHVLAVSEVENVLLLPRPFMSLAKLLQFDEQAAVSALESLKVVVFKAAADDLQRFCIDYARRRIDAQMKRIGLSARDIAALHVEFGTCVGQIDVNAIYVEIEGRIRQMLDRSDYEGVLSIFDHKGLLSEAAKILGVRGLRELEEFIGRSLRSEAGKDLHDALVAVLPTPVPS